MAETGQQLTYTELDERSARLAQLLHAAGLRPGDHVLVMSNGGFGGVHEKLLHALTADGNDGTVAAKQAATTP